MSLFKVVNNKNNVWIMTIEADSTSQVREILADDDDYISEFDIECDKESGEPNIKIELYK